MEEPIKKEDGKVAGGVKVTPVEYKICKRCNKPKDGPFKENELCACGRPPKYEEETTVMKAEEYLASCQEKFVVKSKPLVHPTHTLTGKDGNEYIVAGKVVTDNEGKQVMETYTTREVNIPTVEGLAYYLKVRRETLYDWEKKFEEFSNIMEALRQAQASRLIDKASSGDYNPTIAKVLLTKHGYREGIDATTNNKDIGVDDELKEKSMAAINTFLNEHTRNTGKQ